MTYLQLNIKVLAKNSNFIICRKLLPTIASTVIPSVGPRGTDDSVSRLQLQAPNFPHSVTAAMQDEDLMFVGIWRR
jgi:hypothetical protein